VPPFPLLHDPTDKIGHEIGVPCPGAQLDFMGRSRAGSGRVPGVAHFGWRGCEYGLLLRLRAGASAKLVECTLCFWDPPRETAAQRSFGGTSYREVLSVAWLLEALWGGGFFPTVC